MVATTVGWLVGAVPLAAAMAIVAIAAFNAGAVRAAPRPAKVIGLQQMVFGLAVVAVTAIAVRA